MSVSQLDRVAIRPEEQRLRARSAAHEAQAWALQHRGAAHESSRQRVAAAIWRYMAAFEHANMVCENRAQVLRHHCR